MVGRITTLMTSAQILSNINSAQDALDTTQQELSTGLSINQPSDNPYGASLATQLNQQIAGLGAYTGQVTDGTAWAQATGTALTNIQSALQRVQELAVEASNGTQSSSDLADIGDEVSQLSQEIIQSANSQYNGQYIFSGSATGTAPYASTGGAYQGNTGSIVRQIGPNTSLQVNTNLSSLLGNGSNDTGLLSTLGKITADLNGTGAGASDLSNQLSALQGNLNTLESMQASNGSTQDRLTQASTTIQSLQTNATTALSNDEDVNMASAMTTFSSEQAAFQAALQAGAKIVQTSLMNFLS
jgi:flagellar hook-associated protein 3 FlgL